MRYCQNNQKGAEEGTWGQVDCPMSPYVQFYELVEFALDGLKEINFRLNSDESPKATLEKIVDEIYDDLSNNEDFENLMKLLTQAILSGKEDERLASLIEQDFIMFQALSELISRGQKLGEFRSGDPYEMAMICIGYSESLTAVSINMDISQGIVNRFRSMPIAKSAFITGHAIASVFRYIVSTAISIFAAIILGFTPKASSIGEWLIICLF